SHYTVSPPTYSRSLHDALPIFPPYWWHAVESSGLNVAVNFWWQVVEEEQMSDAFLAMYSGIYGLRQLPLEYRRAWKEFFDHFVRSEEHTSELQSRENLVCRLLL